MFSTHHTLAQLFRGIAIAASITIIAVPSAVASTSSRSFITDTLGGNGHAAPASGYDPAAYVNGGASPSVAAAIEAVGRGRAAAPSVAPDSNRTDSGETRFSWGDAGIGGGLAAGLMVLLLCGARLRTHRRGVLTA